MRIVLCGFIHLELVTTVVYKHYESFIVHLNLSLHHEPHGEDKGQQLQVASGEVFSQYKKENFYGEIISHWNNTPRDVVNSPSLRVFKMQLDWLLGNLG